VRDADALLALDALEHAYVALVGALELPAPAADGALGGDDSLDAYLVTEGDDPVGVDHDEPSAWGFDRASGFCRLLAGDRTFWPRAATLCVAEAIALGLDPAATPHLRRAFATALWWSVGQPTALDVEAIAEFQRQPEQGALQRERNATSEGAALLFEHLEHTLGASGIGTLATALLAASGQRSTFERPEWNNEPDVVDVLRAVGPVTRRITTRSLKSTTIVSPSPRATATANSVKRF
jgi:hypothetical protein